MTDSSSDNPANHRKKPAFRGGQLVPAALPKIDCDSNVGVDRKQLAKDLNQAAADQSASPDPKDSVSHWKKDLLGLSSSFAFHLLILVILSLWVFQNVPPGTVDVPATFSPDSNSDADSVNVSMDSLQDNSEILTPASDFKVPPNPVQAPVFEEATSPIQNATAASNATPAGILTRPTGGSLVGRKNRGELSKREGGTQGSEDAVSKGLRWIANHQREDGSWAFQHPDGCTCRGREGDCTLRTAATGLALLAFLGRNHSHLREKDPYRKVVKGGLDYLKRVGAGGDLTQLHEKAMYGQGIATLALCEAYAVTEDPELRAIAQAAVDFIVKAQHPKGVWRYQPQDLGDITVTGWQLMALKTAKLAGLDVPKKAIDTANRFVATQSVSSTGGFTYPGRSPYLALPGPSAIGLLMQMFNGFALEEEEIQRGVTYLSDHGYSATDMYFNYYSTQVLFHFGGDQWKAWNAGMRDFLVNNQQHLGHEDGSWNFIHLPYTNEGGRLYNTVFAVLILEVYYRHLRLYEKDALDRGFPLD